MTKRIDSALKQINDSLEISTRFHKLGFSHSNHWHDYFEFEIVLDGEYEHTVRNEKTIARRGSAWIMNHLDFHSFKCNKDATILNISFTGYGINKNIIDVLSSSIGGFLCEFDSQKTVEIYEKAQIAKNEMINKPPLWQENVKAIVESILIETIRKVPFIPNLSNDKVSGVLQNVISYIYKNYSKDLSLVALSKKFDISAGHLGLVFSKTFGVSISNYVTNVRMKYACNFLEDSDLSIKEISYICGFKSIEYFHYAFKTHMQMTPANYRENAKKQKGNQFTY